MHNHLVPGVDDGSRSLDETIECLQIMYNCGYRRAYITPHYQTPRFPNTEDDIAKRFNTLKKELKEHDCPMELLGVAGEYRVDDSFAKRIENSCFSKVADKYVLVELSLHQPRMGVEETIFDLSMKGFDVILAHPERYPYYSRSSEILERLKEQGVLFQINVLSLSGFYGEVAMRKAYDYVNAGWVELIGTDMHNPMYAQALIDASNNRKVQKLIESHSFMNNTL